MFSSGPGPSLAAAAASPSPASPAHGRVLILMPSWGGSVLSRCPACSLKGSWEPPSSAGSPESQLCSRKAQWCCVMPLFQHTSAPHTHTNQRTKPVHNSLVHAVGSHQLLRTSHQEMRSGSVPRVLRLWFSCTFSKDSQMLNTPGNIPDFPRWTCSRDLPPSLMTHTHP